MPAALPLSTHLHSFTAAHLMTRRLVTLHPDDPLRTSLTRLARHRISSAPVLDQDGLLVGLVSEHDCLEGLLASLHHRRPPVRVRDAMSTRLHTTPSSATLLQLAHRFVHERLRRLLVVDTPQRLVGMVSRHDLVHAAAHARLTTRPTAGPDTLYLTAVGATPPVERAEHA